jgi:putative restriction endonuclease
LYSVLVRIFSVKLCSTSGLARCAVTGLSQLEMLRASHMKPWAACENDMERLDPMNGLLLSAHWDAAFDSGLLTFDDDGTVLWSPMLSESARRLLIAGTVGEPKAAALRSSNLPYLSYHRAIVWEKSA